MPLKRTVFRFSGTNQQTGARHIQQGQLVEAKNVRQLKDGEYRKRRGFDRIEPIEALIIDNILYRRNESTVAGNMFSTGTISQAIAVGDGEVVLNGGTSEQNTHIPWYWPALGATKIRVGVTCRATISVADITLRVRIGADPTVTYLAVAGTVAHALLLSFGAAQDIDFVSTDTPTPTTAGLLQYTIQTGAALAGIDTDCFMPWFRPMGAGQVIGLPITRTLTFGGGSEVLYGQWYVDFDQFSSSVSSLTVGHAFGHTSKEILETLTVRTRLGGTAGASDGTLLSSSTGYGASVDIVGGQATIAKPTGTQLVKLTVEMSSFNCNAAGGSVLLVAV